MDLGKSDRTSGEAGPSLVLRLDPTSGVPTYLQIVQQVERALQLGHLLVGDQLPRVKDVVGALSINPNTVLKAYRELEHRGIAASRPGRGTFVEAAPPTVGIRELSRLRRSLLTGWLPTAAKAGLDASGTAALFDSTWREFWHTDSGADEARSAGDIA